MAVRPEMKPDQVVRLRETVLFSGPMLRLLSERSIDPREVHDWFEPIRIGNSILYSGPSCETIFAASNNDSEPYRISEIIRADDRFLMSAFGASWSYVEDVFGAAYFFSGKTVPQTILLSLPGRKVSCLLDSLPFASDAVIVAADHEANGLRVTFRLEWLSRSYLAQSLRLQGQMRTDPSR